jgi:uncharacterized ion transporter superfamily protein YfcC
MQEKTMEQKAGAQISAKAFLQSLLILFVLMMLAGVLTRIIPAGTYQRQTLEDRTVIVPDSFSYTEHPNYPVWRWFTAPVEVLWRADNSLTIIVITVFILMVGAAFAILDKTGILQAAIGGIVRAFGDRKYLLLLVIAFFFMFMGAVFGIFEEVVLLVPIMLALSYSLGWDALVGLGMSILAVNLGFSAAITNPFNIGIAQEIAGLPTFSGTGLRVIIFLAIYALFAVFLLRYARKIERSPETSPVYADEAGLREKYTGKSAESLAEQIPGMNRARTWLVVMLVIILAVLFSGPFIPAISDFTLPLVGVLFLAAGLGAGLLSGRGGRLVGRAVAEGVSGIAPGIPLILMAASIKYIADSGGIMDTILHNTSTALSGVSPFLGAILIYALALFIEIFIASSSAKAFLLMPILFPLADLVGVTRQIVVTAYCFGDGFSNMAYPTNPVLLIALGLTVVSFPKWIRWTWRLWLGILLVSVAFLGIAVIIGYGPF